MACGSGSAVPPSAAWCAAGGKGASHTVTGKADGLLFAAVELVGRCGTVAAAKRTAIGIAAPSTVSAGQPPSSVTARATGPPSPMTT